jgi:hypothetical protein
MSREEGAAGAVASKRHTLILCATLLAIAAAGFVALARRHGAGALRPTFCSACSSSRSSSPPNGCSIASPQFAERPASAGRPRKRHPALDPARLLAFLPVALGAALLWRLCFRLKARLRRA